MALDTYDIVRELRAVGFEEAQADTLSRLLKRAQDVDFGHLATKVDLDGSVLQLEGKFESGTARLDGKIEITRAQIEARLETTRAQLEAKIEAAKAEMIKWMFGTIGLQTLVIVGTVVVLVRGLGRG